MYLSKKKNLCTLKWLDEVNKGASGLYNQSCMSLDFIYASIDFRLYLDNMSGVF